MTDTAETPAAAVDPADLISAATAAWRAELLELGGPNTLLWPTRDPHVLDLTHAHPGGVAMLLAGREVRLSDVIREPGALLRVQRQAHRLAAHTDEIAEEHGIQTCFLSMGAASWQVPGQDERPVAPVLLRRAVLRRIEGGPDHALDLGERVELNPVLLTYLRRALHQDIDGHALVERGRTGGRGFNPQPVYDELLRLCARLPQLRIEPRLVVAAHPYGKAESLERLATLGTLDDPPAGLLALAGGPALQPATTGAPSVAEDACLDLPLEQQLVIDRVAAGEDLYVDAPPGTDPAGLVASVIAQSALARDSVLLLAEKSAVIEEVRERLGRIGLEGLLLHVGDPAATIDARLVTERWPEAPRTDSTGRPRTQARDAARRVDAHVRAVHATREPWGVSVADAHDAIVELAAHRPAPRSRVRLDASVLARHDAAGREQLAARLTDLARRRAWRPEKTHEPWAGASLATQEEVDEVLEALERLRGGSLDTLRTTVREVFVDIAEPRATCPADHGHFLAEIEQIRDTLEIFRPAVFDTPVEPLLAATQDHSGLGLVERRRLRSQIRSLLRPGRPPADLHGALAAAAEQRRSWARLTGGGGRPRVPEDIDRAHRAYERVYADLTELGAALGDTSGGGELLTTQWHELEQRLDSLARDVDGARIVPDVIADLQALRDEGLGELLDDLVARRVPAAAVADEVRYVWWMSLRSQVADAEPEYGSTTGADLDGALAAFVDADRAALRDNAAHVARRQRDHFRDLARLRRTIAREIADVAADELVAPTWPVALRRWGPVLHAAAPAWGMSPSVVGQLLGDEDDVDLVVVADASRTTVARAAAGIARGRRLLVVGDRGQLPPATWTADGGVRPPATPDRSLADVAAVALPLAPLRAVSQPRPEVPDLGVEHASADEVRRPPLPGPVPRPRLVHVDGRAVLDERTGLVPTTAAEVDAVVDLVREHLARGDGSLGVVTFSDEHARHITEAVTDLTRSSTAFAAALRGLPEPFVVKDVRRWQAEERDHVVVSVGHGRTPQGRVVSRLGDLGGPDGDRRVLLAATRARSATTWVTTLTADELTGERADRPGHAALRTVLRGLESPAPQASAGAKGADPRPLVADLVARLRADGYTVRTGVGGDHPVDLAVAHPEDPDRLLLAVDVDGPPTQDLATSREHDRRRGEVLERLGWSYLRLWSTEIYADPARQVARVVRALHRAAEEEGP